MVFLILKGGQMDATNEVRYNQLKQKSDQGQLQGDEQKEWESLKNLHPDASGTAKTSGAANQKQQD